MEPGEEVIWGLFWDFDNSSKFSLFHHCLRGKYTFIRLADRIKWVKIKCMTESVS